MTGLLFHGSGPRPRWRRWPWIVGLVLGAAAVALMASPRLRSAAVRQVATLAGDDGGEPGALLRTPRGQRTVESVMAEIGPDTERLWRQRFADRGLPWPPAHVTLLALKNEKRLEVWASHGPAWRRVAEYPIRAASGAAGPKLREGDRQVPEGRYRITAFNANSSYHLSLKLDYPSADDLARARRDGRDSPGSDIFIHGRAASIGCLAMGDAVIEELWSLVYAAGRAYVDVLILPNDLRRGPPVTDMAGQPAWLPELYARLTRDAAALTE